GNEPTRGQLAPRGRAVVLAVQGRLALAIAVEPLVRELVHEVEEAAKVTTLAMLVIASEPHELADVGHPALAAGHGEQPQVVAGALQRPFDQPVERTPRRLGALGAEHPDEALDPRAALRSKRIEQAGGVVAP